MTIEDLLGRLTAAGYPGLLQRHAATCSWVDRPLRKLFFAALEAPFHGVVPLEEVDVKAAASDGKARRRSCRPRHGATASSFALARGCQSQDRPRSG